jgi:hypothetical protein
MSVLFMQPYIQEVNFSVCDYYFRRMVQLIRACAGTIRYISLQPVTLAAQRHIRCSHFHESTTIFSERKTEFWS